MTDRPIIFSAPMVRALLDGRKTQTRRVLKRTDLMEWDGKEMRPIPVGYTPGDRLWVREAWQAHSWASDCVTIRYRAEERTAGFTQQIEQIKYPGGDKNALKYVAPQGPHRWRPSIHMPRWASRLTLIVTDVRVQRLQNISEADAVAEGIEPDQFGAWHCYQAEPKGPTFWACPRESFRTLWNSLHGPDAWAANPWVVAISFTVHRRNIDQMEAPHD
jgi:hypothetical protein